MSDKELHRQPKLSKLDVVPVAGVLPDMVSVLTGGSFLAQYLQVGTEDREAHALLKSTLEDDLVEEEQPHRGLDVPGVNRADDCCSHGANRAAQNG